MSNKQLIRFPPFRNSEAGCHVEVTKGHGGKVRVGVIERSGLVDSYVFYGDGWNEALTKEMLRAIEEKIQQLNDNFKWGPVE